MAVRIPAGLPARPRLLVPVVIVVAVVLVLAGVAVALYTDLLWFREAGFPTIFSTVLRTRALLFIGFGLLMAVAIAANLLIAYRSRPPFRPMSLEQQNLERYRVAVEPYLRPVLLLTSGIIGIFAGLSAAGHWQTWLLWRNATSFGQKDAQFGKDISFYTFSYPMYRFALTFVLTAVILSLIAAAATHYLFGGVRLQSPGDKVSPAARVHLSVLIGIVVLLKALAYYLDRYGLVFSLRGRVQGASYTDVHSVLPAKNILVGVAIICALLFFANIVVRNVILPAGALALLVLSAVVIGGLYPAYTQQFRVKPNEIDREAPFIKRNIDATRVAYSINDVQTTPYAGNGADPAALRNDRGTAPNARLLDPNQLSATFTRNQQLRGYFGFPSSLDIDRYNLGDGVQDYVVAVRELNQDGLSDTQRNWINQHLIYTHGNGFVAAPANRVDDQGQPVYTVGGLPVQGPLKVTEPRIYYGEGTTDYAIVGSKQAETDGEGDNAPTYRYNGTGGIKLTGLSKLAYALKFREKNILLSGAVASGSKLMYIREPRARVQKVAPFLQLDEDPYPAVVDGRVLWIVDGYTTSAGYPYGERTTLGQATADSQTSQKGRLPDQQVNYIRNSVKATVDAFDGTVKLYTWDEQDPVLKTWSKAFGGKILQPKSAISNDLRAHLRYPEDLFKVQRELLTKYHLTDPREFYQGDQYWQIPADPTNGGQPETAAAGQGAATPQLFGSGSKSDLPPYYVVAQPPGTSKPSFSLITPFVARNGQSLTAFASVSSDDGDYGKIRILQLPSGATVNGPVAAATQFQNSAAVRDRLLSLRSGSQVVLGNLLTLPVGTGFLYVEPVYVKAQGASSYPTLQYVIASYGSKVAIGSDFGDALKQLYGGAAATPPTGSNPPPPSTGSTVAQLAAQAQIAYTDGQKALAKGDFAAYGVAQARLKTLLDQLASTANPSGSASPSPPSSAQPAPSPSR